MSSKITGLVWELDLSANKQLVLLALADHADHEGNNVYPSVPLIAWKTGYSERQIQRIMKALVSDKILVVAEQAKGKTIRYKIDISAGVKKSPLRGDKMSPVPTSTPDNMSPDPRHSYVTSTGDIAMSPEPLLEPSINLSAAAVAAPEKSQSDSETPPKETVRKSPKRTAPRIEKPYDDVAHNVRSAIIKGWASNLKAAPTNAFHSDQNHLAAAQIARAGYTVVDVERYVKAAMADKFWRGKTLTLTKVGELMPAWLVTHPITQVVSKTNGGVEAVDWDVNSGVRRGRSDQGRAV